MTYRRTPERTLIEDALIQANGMLVTVKGDYEDAGRKEKAARIGEKIELIQAALKSKHELEAENGELSHARQRYIVELEQRDAEIALLNNARDALANWQRNALKQIDEMHAEIARCHAVIDQLRDKASSNADLEQAERKRFEQYMHERGIVKDEGIGALDAATEPEGK
jgi:chromosome segregation ATPase